MMFPQVRNARILYEIDGLYDYGYIWGLKYRAPAVDITKPYVVCLGNSFMFGRFCERAIPHFLTRLNTIQFMNLGAGHSSDALVSHSLQHVRLLKGSSAVIVPKDWHESGKLSAGPNIVYEMPNLTGFYPSQDEVQEVAEQISKNFNI